MNELFGYTLKDGESFEHVDYDTKYADVYKGDEQIGYFNGEVWRWKRIVKVEVEMFFAENEQIDTTEVWEAIRYDDNMMNWRVVE